jgi:hypothetical protein
MTLSQAAAMLGHAGKGKSSPRKAITSRENGKMPVKPGSRPRGRPKGK